MDPASPELLDTAKGPIEVARRGSGPPVLLVHGSPGGSDSSLAMGRFLVEAGFELIAPSRPGYLTTPLEGRESIDAQADLLAALLDALGHDRAGMVTWSGGGPSGYRLAVRHPERVSALVAFAAVSHDYHLADEDFESELMKTRPGNWALSFLADHAPKSAIAQTLKAEGDLTKQELKALVDEVVGDEAQRDVVLTMVHVVGDYEHRRAGMDNDFAQFAEHRDARARAHRRADARRQRRRGHRRGAGVQRSRGGDHPGGAAARHGARHAPVPVRPPGCGAARRRGWSSTSAG